MSPSVSSERACSSAGITISKRRNRLKGDIVEALQFLKCVIRRDLLFRKEALLDEGDEDVTLEVDAEVFDSWDAFLDESVEEV
jgi:hypothetical protein